MTRRPAQPALPRQRTGRTLAFDQMPQVLRCAAYGVEYLRLNQCDGGMLYLTRYGWLLLGHLLPENWYHNQRYRADGEKLKGGSGTVYRVPTWSRVGRRKDLVIKFSRFAQDVPLEVCTEISEMFGTTKPQNARFNDPFEEFGMAMALRRLPRDPSMLPIRTKRPLAIYVPPGSHKLWQLGRSRARFREHQRVLERDQADSVHDKKIALDIHREYVALYEWVDGKDAETFYDLGELSQEEMRELTLRSALELTERGFQVLDHKPKHLILRHRKKDGRLLRHQGELVYALVDFELLKRLPQPDR